ncbi:ESPR domain-containing protein [Azohydromonas australica]|uniref:ESPR domain-containing protein n=1 Tax=Azohydromonas australica TaxID=364039 RepID=UPI00041E9AEF|nr:ESPR domain-containing protein [Azohydromonas australica]
MRRPSLNHVFRVVWNAASGSWVAVAENRPGRGKSSSRAAVAAVVLAGLAGMGAAQAGGLTAIVDGQGGGGCTVGVGGCALPNSNALFTNFYTQGGAGSGGGAGLGGVFFVNSGASLSLNDVTFEHNAVKGGEGGSTPDVAISSATVSLTEKTADVTSVTAFQVSATVSSSNGSLTVSGVTLSNANPLLKAGSAVSMGGGTATIGTISGNTVSFSTPLTVDASAIKTLSGATLTNGTTTIGVANFAGLANSDVATGMNIVGAGIPQGTTITSVARDANNAVTSITLSKPIDLSATGQPLQMVGASLKLVDLTSFQASQFASLGNNQIRLPAAGLGLSVGMELTGTGVPEGTVITAINGDVVTTSNAITGMGFKGTLPVGRVGGNTL